MSAVTESQGSTYIFQEIDSCAAPGKQKGIKATLRDSFSMLNRVWNKLFEHTIEYREKVYVVDWENFLDFASRNKFGCWKEGDMSGTKANIIKAYKEKMSAQGKEIRGLMTAAESFKAGVWELTESEIKLVFDAIEVPPSKRQKILDCFVSVPLEGSSEKIEYKGNLEEFFKALDTVDHKLPEELPASLPIYLRRKAEALLTVLKEKQEVQPEIQPESVASN